MRVFLSWSGTQSKALAEALRDYLPTVIQSVEPWFSPEDIDKGSRWLSELSSQLQSQSVAIVCVTQESLNSHWLLFEVGALSKMLEASWVCPVLLGVEPADIQGPLAQFQATKATKDDIRRLLATINRRLETPLSDAQIDKVHNLLWPELEQRIADIAALQSPERTHRSTGELVAEILESVRALDRKVSAISEPRNLSPDVLAQALLAAGIAVPSAQRSWTDHLARRRRTMQELALSDQRTDLLSDADSQALSADLVRWLDALDKKAAAISREAAQNSDSAERGPDSGQGFVGP